MVIKYQGVLFESLQYASQSQPCLAKDKTCFGKKYSIRGQLQIAMYIKELSAIASRSRLHEIKTMYAI